MGKSSSIISNFIWRFLERCGAQIVSLVISIILARLIAPEVYGSIALVTVFITLLQVFVDSGLGVSLIQKKDADDVDFSTVFYFNLAMCIFIYAVVFICAPFVASFYNDASLTPVIRVLSLTLIASGIRSVQQAYVSKNMLFKRFFFSTIGGTLFSAVVGVIMAYKGFGIWALVMQHLLNSVVNTLILWATVSWRPKLCFSFKRLKGLFSFGWKILVSSLIDTVYRDIRQLIIGKFYSSSDLAFYNKGNQFPQLIVNNVNISIDSVLLPTMSKVQDERSLVKEITRRSIKTSTYIIAPLMIGLACLSSTVIELLLTKIWLPAVPYLMVFCITYLFYPIHTANLNAIKALGKSDYYLKLEILKKVLGCLVLLITVWYGPFVMCASGIFTSFLSQVINSWPNKKLLGYSLAEQYKDIAPALIISLIMGVLVWTLGAILSLPLILELIIQVVLGAVIYISLSVLFKLDAFYFVFNTLKGFIKK